MVIAKNKDEMKSDLVKSVFVAFDGRNKIYTCDIQSIILGKICCSTKKCVPILDLPHTTLRNKQVDHERDPEFTSLKKIAIIKIMVHDSFRKRTPVRNPEI